MEYERDLQWPHLANEYEEAVAEYVFTSHFSQSLILLTCMQ